MPTRRSSYRAAVVSIAAAGLMAASGSRANAAADTKGNPVDDVVSVVAQVVYPDAEGVDEGFTAQERLEGLLGLNDYPGGPFGSWGPHGVGLYGDLGNLVGDPPIKRTPPSIEAATNSVR